MKCPQCEVDMTKIAISAADIWECPTCRGMWFDQGELETVKDEVLPDLGWLGVDEWQQQAEFKVHFDPKSCPKCNDIALTRVTDPQSGTEMHLCTFCKGVWLPTGQFLNLVNALLDVAEQKSAPEYAQICLRQAKEMLTSKDSLDSEWQDLKQVLIMLKYRIFIDHPKLKNLLIGLQKSLPL